MPEEPVSRLEEDWALADELTVWVMLDVKKMVLPWTLLTGIDALLLLVCGNDVAIPRPEEVLSAELEVELPGVI
jgi:hypothetical protein